MDSPKINTGTSAYAVKEKDQNLTNVEERVDRWAALKTKIKKAQQIEKTLSSFKHQSADERESSLRAIIEQFQTRRMKEVKHPSMTNSEQRDLNLATRSKKSNENNGSGSARMKSIMLIRKMNDGSTDTFTTQSNRATHLSWFVKCLLPLIDFFMTFGLVGNVFLVPILVSFKPVDRWMWNIQVFNEICLLVYFLVNSTIVYNSRSLRVGELSTLEHQRKEWLLWDCVGMIPLNTVIGFHTCYSSRYACSLPIATNFLKLPVLLNRLKIVILERLESSDSRKMFLTLYRATRIVMIILVIMNILACLWFFIGTAPDDGSLIHTDWFRLMNEETLGYNYDGLKRSELWLQSIYYSLLILIGDGVIPRSSQQHAFCAFMMIFGTVGTAVLIGETANLIQKMQAAKSRFDLKIENLDYMMGYLKLPKMLQYRVKEYYEFLWNEHRCLNGDPTPFLNELSPSLKAEVDLFLKRGLILQSNLFIEAPPQFVRDVSAMLEIVFYLRGDYIVREGEQGNSMFFISKGTLRVCIRGTYIKDMQEGNCFGEIAILRESSRRSASVYAHTHSTLYVLSRSSVHNLAAVHPGILEKAIENHYSHASPMGRRSSLVFGRKKSLDEFRIDSSSTASPGKQKFSNVNFHTLNELKSPFGDSGRGNVVCLMQDGEELNEMNESCETVKSISGDPMKSVSPSRKSSAHHGRRHSQSMLGLEFRLQLILNTIGLESEGYQFLLLGCETAAGVKNVLLKDLKNISEVQFNKLQQLCATEDDENSDNNGKETDTESEDDSNVGGNK